MKRKTLLSWSSGKDCVWMLRELQRWNDIDVKGLFCTINEKYQRIAMHGVRVELLRAQAESIGLPLTIIELPDPCSDELYKDIMREFVVEAKSNGIECFAFGDLFLEDIRTYREQQLKGTGIEPIFPIWGMQTEQLSREILAHGVKTIITCVDSTQLPAECSGRLYDADFLAGLPDGVDPCGENGEFHTFVFDGPMFSCPLDVQTGETVWRDQFVFSDVVLTKI